MSSSTSATISAYYQSIQFRTGPAGEIKSYSALVADGAMTLEQVRAAIIDDPYTTNNVDVVVRMYQAAFGRLPEAASSLEFYADRLASGVEQPWTLAFTFARSPEFVERYGLTFNERPNAAFITAMYLNVLGRAPDDAGFAYYLNGSMTVSQILQGFAQSPEFRDRTDAAVESLLNANALGTANFTGPLQIVTPAQSFMLTTDRPSITEGDAGQKALTFTLTLSEAPTMEVVVNYQTLSSGSAKAGDDFVVDAGTVTFAAGQRTATVSVNVLGDTAVEGPETVQVQFSGSRLVRSVEATGTITNDDTANAPVSAVSDSNAAANTVAENAVRGTVVGITALATDATASETVTYALTSNPGNLFAVDAATGVVTVAGAIDFETAASHSITVRATSSDGSTQNANFTIAVTNLNDNEVSAIVDANTAANTVAENAAVGAVVGLTASATDADAGATVSYSLTNRDGSAYTGPLLINSSTGVVTVGSALNFEAATSHEVVVRATSSDGSVNSQAFTVAVTNVNDNDVSAVTDSNAAANTLAENAQVGAVVGITALATDADAGAAVTYSLTDDAGGRFAINSSTGVVTLASALDFETAASHTITVRAASSDGSAATTANFSIAVTDVVEPQTFTLTAGVDGAPVFVGAGANDTFNAGLENGTAATLGNLDSLNGGAGTDTLNVTLNGGTVMPGGLTSIEQVNVTSTSAASVLDLRNSDSVANIASIGSTTALTLNNIQSAATNVTIANSAAVHDLSYAAAAVAGSADSASVTVNGFVATINDTADLVVGNGIETLNLTAAGTNAIDTAFSGRIVIAGTGSLTLSGVGAGVEVASTNVDASANSGGVTMIMNAASTVTGGSGADSVTMGAGAGSISGGAGNDTLVGVGAANDTLSGGDGDDSIVSGAGVDSLVGGAGNDTFNMSTALNLTIDDTVAGGDGTDTLLVDIDDVDTTAAPNGNTTWVNISGIETLGLTGISAAETVTTANIASGINRVNLNDDTAGNLTLNLGSGAQTVGLNIAAAIGAGHVLTVDAAGTGSSDSLTITNMRTATDNIGSATSDITVTDFETVTINVGSYTNAVAQTLNDVNVGNNSLVLQGGNRLDIEGTFTARSIDGSAMSGIIDMTGNAAEYAGASGSMTISGGSAADVLLGDADEATIISGGAGNDSITGGTAADNLGGDAGDDTIAGGGGNDTLAGGDGNDSLTGGTGNDSILGGAGNDVIATDAGTDIVDGGDGNDAITSLSTTASTLNGGAGNDTITNITGGNLSINGGEGNDTIVRTNVLSLTDTIAGGDGTDILSVNAADVARIAAGSFSAVTNWVNNLSGVERLMVSTALNNQTLDVGTFDGVGHLTVAGTTGAASTISNMVDNSTVIQTANLAVGLTLGYAATSGTQTLNYEMATSAALTNTAALTVAGVEIINLNSNDTDVTTGGNAAHGFTLTAAAATNLNITGDSASLALTLTAASLTTIDASAYEGTVTATLQAAGSYNGAIGVDNITGSSGADLINGNAGNDVLSGEAGADTLNGGAGNDQLTGGAGADVIDGGDGTDTLIASGGDSNTGGPSAITGVVVNLSGSTISYASVFSATGAYLSGALTGIETGKVGYLFGGESSLNITTQDTVSNIENVTGGTGADYIVGSSAANVITGGAGVDTMTGGAGNDVFIVGGNSGDLDVITDFATANDVIDVVSTETGNAGEYSETDGSGLTVAAVLALRNTGSGADASIAVYYNVENTGDAYVVIDDIAGGTYDKVIKLVGIDLASEIDISNFI